MHRHRVLFVILLASSVAAGGACISEETPDPSGMDAGKRDATGTPPSDARPTVPEAALPDADASAPIDSAADVGVDAPAEANADAPPDVVVDTGSDAADASVDATVDAPPDVVADAGPDVVADAKADVVVDAGPVLVGGGFGRVLAITADENDVYFTTYGTSDAGTYNKDGMVVRCPIEGGCAASTTVLGTGLNNPEHVAIEGTRLFVGASGAVGSGQFDGFVYSCPLAGCGVANVDRITVASGLRNLGGITARDGYVYWVHTETTNTAGRAQYDGGDFRWLGNANAYSSVGIAVDDNNAYWTHTYYPPAIHVASFDGGGARILVDIVARDGGLSPQSLKHDNGYLYYVSVLAHDVRRVAVDGTGLERLAGGMSNPFRLVVDATNVYVSEQSSPQRIRRVPKTGGAATILAAAGQEINGLAVNGAWLLWASNDGRVWRVPK